MREVYETNVFGVIIVTNAMLPLLRGAPAARIVNLSSEVGSIGSEQKPASASPPWTPTPPAASSGATCGPPEPRTTPTAPCPGERFARP
jgi:NAD(P)-dependent dehydrogenase (short-subunit alcohol dehydrogenase family)